MEGEQCTTLIACNNVDVNNVITSNGTGGVNLYADWDGVSTVTRAVGSSGFINVNAPNTTGGGVHLVAGGNILQGAPGAITAAGLLVSGNSGSVNLILSTNSVGAIAGSAQGQFAFKNSGDLVIGTVGGTSGITAIGGSPGLDVTVNVEITGGSLTVANNVYAQAGNGASGQAGGNAVITLSAKMILRFRLGAKYTPIAAPAVSVLAVSAAVAVTRRSS